MCDDIADVLDRVRLLEQSYRQTVLELERIREMLVAGHLATSTALRELAELGEVFQTIDETNQRLTRSLDAQLARVEQQQAQTADLLSQLERFDPWQK